MRNQLTGLTLSIETDSASLISTRFYPFDLSNRKLYYGTVQEEFMSYPSKASQFLPLGTNLRKPLQSKLWKIAKSKIETSQNSVTTNVGFALSNNLLSSNMKLDYSFLFNSSADESRVEIENGRIKNTTVEMLCLSDNLSCELSTISKFNFVCNCGNDSNISLAQRVTTLYLDTPITPPSPSSQNQNNSNLGYLGFLALIPLILLIILIPVVVIIVRLKQKPKMSNPKNTSDIPMQTL